MEATTELYPGQAYFHAHNAKIRDSEIRFLWWQRLKNHMNDLMQQDLARLKELSDEALHPTSPTRGHSLMCPCHRCRMYREGLK